MSGGRRRTGRATRPCDVRHETYDIRATEKEDPDCRTDIAHPLPLRLPPPRQCHCQCQRPTPPACRPSPAAVFIVYFFARACVRHRARRVLSAISPPCCIAYPRRLAVVSCPPPDTARPPLGRPGRRPAARCSRRPAQEWDRTGGGRSSVSENERCPVLLFSCLCCLSALTD